MNARQAILRAADYIERHPSRFDFRVVKFPRPDDDGASREVLNLPAEDHSGAEFYDRMDSFSGYGWRNSATECARTLRIYADKYHPAESRALIPASVRAIFTMTPEQIRAEFLRAEA